MTIELLGVDPIVKILNDFLAPWGVTAELGTDFCYYPDLHIIDFAMVESEICQREFRATIEHCNPDVDMDDFLWSLLHELGHHVTCSTIPDWRWARWAKLKKLCESGKLPRHYYYAFEDERKATNWAVKFANTHIEELAALWEKLQPAIMNFYDINEIDLREGDEM